MSDDNLKIWDAVAKPPKEALKEIRGGRLKGMTDIKPQWRYKVMTEQFGMCGIGWKYVTIKEWVEPASDNQIVCFVNIELFVKSDGEWSDAIPGSGGSMLVEKETRGLHTSDEAFKMATTDALGVAMQKIGVAADIYMGKWTGSKYKDEPQSSPTPQRNWIKEIQTTTTLNELKCIYEEAYEATSGTEQGKIVMEKDKRKQILTREQ